MDDTTLAGLEAALAASPANAALRTVLAQAQLDRGSPAAAIELLAPIGADADPAVEVIRARAHLALGQAAEADAAYRRAVAASSGLEDVGLASEIESALRLDGSPPPRAGDNVLRLIVGGAEKADGDLAAAVLAPPRPPVTFADVGGLDEVKEQIRKRIILPFLKPSLFERFKRKAGGGILLYGPPGCGKTLLARATAGECSATFLAVEISDVLDMYIGESEAKLHALFEKARASTPSVLFFDEIEALGGRRNGRHESSTLRLVSQFLAEMDGFAQANRGVLVLGATNLPWAVDSAFRRPGRFDRFVFVPPPDRDAREAILRIHLRDRPVAGSVDPAAIAAKTSGHSGADLEGLVDSAADAAIESTLASGRDVAIASEHFATALAGAKPTTVEWLTTARNHARYANEGGQYDDVLDFLRRNGKA